MKGLSRHTGQVIEGADYLRERIQSALTMRVGTSVMRRTKGSRLPELIDAPTNARNLFEIQLAALDALRDPANGLADINVRRVSVDTDRAGQVIVTVEYAVTDGTATVTVVLG